MKGSRRKGAGQHKSGNEKRYREEEKVWGSLGSICPWETEDLIKALRMAKNPRNLAGRGGVCTTC